MRKIERDMNRAIRTGRNFSSSNTTVKHGWDNEADVYLHGNHIATLTTVAGKYNKEIHLYDGGYQSNTTKSRLNAILFEFGLGMENVFQKQWNWYVNVNTGNGAMSTVDFRSGMRLA